MSWYITTEIRHLKVIVLAETQAWSKTILVNVKVSLTNITRRKMFLTSCTLTYHKAGGFHTSALSAMGLFLTPCQYQLHPFLCPSRHASCYSLFPHSLFFIALPGFACLICFSVVSLTHRTLRPWGLVSLTSLCVFSSTVTETSQAISND